MKAVIYQDKTDRFLINEIDKPSLETPFDVIIKVHAVGLNPVDAKVNLWSDMILPGSRPFVGGLDVAGVIVAKGANVHDWHIGDKVLYHGNMYRRQGGFASLAVHDSRTLTKHPHLSAIEAAASPCAGWTAYRAVKDKLHIENKESILVYGASGGVGSYALQLSRYFKVKTIIAVCSENNFEYAKSLGATHCFDYRDQELVKKISSLVPSNGIDCVLDCIGGDAQTLTSSLLGFDGELVELVSTIDSTQHFNTFDRGLTFHQLSLGAGHNYGQKGFDSIISAGDKMNNLLEKNSISTPNIFSIRFEEIPETLYQIRLGHSRGKYVAVMDE